MLETVTFSGSGAPCKALLLLSGSSIKVLVDGSVRTEVLRPGMLTLRFESALGMIELTLRDFPWPIRPATGVVTLSRLPRSV